MDFIEVENHITRVNEMLEQMEEIYTDLRLENLEIAKSYDEALERIITELEADRVYYIELLEEATGEIY